MIVVYGGSIGLAANPSYSAVCLVSSLCNPFPSLVSRFVINLVIPKGAFVVVVLRVLAAKMTRTYMDNHCWFAR